MTPLQNKEVRLRRAKIPGKTAVRLSHAPCSPCQTLTGEEFPNYSRNFRQAGGTTRGVPCHSIRTVLLTRWRGGAAFGIGTTNIIRSGSARTNTSCTYMLAVTSHPNERNMPGMGENRRKTSLGDSLFTGTFFHASASLNG